jgi:hypothetical protein
MPKLKISSPQPKNEHEIILDREIPLATLSFDSTLNNDPSYQSSIAKTTTSILPRVYGRAQIIQVPPRKPTTKPYTLSKRRFWITIGVVSACMVVFVAGTVYLVIDGMKIKDSRAGYTVIPLGGNGTLTGNDNAWEVFQVSAGERRRREIGVDSGIWGMLLGLGVVVMFC